MSPLAKRYRERYQGFIVPHVEEKFEDLDLRREIQDPEGSGAEEGQAAPLGGLRGGGMGGGPPAGGDKNNEDVKMEGLVGCCNGIEQILPHR